MPSKNPQRRYQDIVHNIHKIKDYVQQGGGVHTVFYSENVYHDAIRICFLEISEAATKLGIQAETDIPSLPWQKIRSIGNYIRHEYDEIDINAMIEAIRQFDETLRLINQHLGQLNV